MLANVFRSLSLPVPHHARIAIPKEKKGEKKKEKKGKGREEGMAVDKIKFISCPWLASGASLNHLGKKKKKKRGGEEGGRRGCGLRIALLASSVLVACLARKREGGKKKEKEWGEKSTSKVATRGGRGKEKGCD